MSSEKPIPDVCFGCGEVSPVVSGVVEDPENKKDRYYCLNCGNSWPTEWNADYENIQKKLFGKTK